MTILSEYATVNEVARRLKVHPETVKRLCRQGDLPAEKIHNTWLVNRTILDLFASTYVPTKGRPRRLI
jgi:excisionase family DNA binding protein